jgi:sulfate transport system permease protein
VSRQAASGVALGYLSVVVLLPLAALAAKSSGGFAGVLNPEARAAFTLTFELAGGVVLVNAVTGTALAWTLVRDDFRGKRVVDAVIDLPFALPTIVAGLTLLTLYHSLAFTRVGVLAALLFVTLPFVVRTVQPVLIELDRDMEEGAASLGAGRLTIFRRIVFPHLLPALLSGVALAFARAIGEFGAVILIAGNIPFKTEVASLYVFEHVNSDDPSGASALAVLMLAISFAVLLAIGAGRRWATRHDR